MGKYAGDVSTVQTSGSEPIIALVAEAAKDQVITKNRQALH